MWFRSPMCYKSVFISLRREYVLLILDATPLKVENLRKQIIVCFYLPFECVNVQCVYAYSPTRVCICMYKSDKIEYFNCSLCYLLRQGLLLNVELSNSASVASQPVANPLTSPPKYQDYKGSATLVWTLLGCLSTQDYVNSTSSSETFPQPLKDRYLGFLTFATIVVSKRLKFLYETLTRTGFHNSYS